MKRITAFISMILLMAAASAQNTLQIPLITTRSASDKAIEIRQLQVSVIVVENIATTTMEMQFYNDNNRVMEGELNFPLPQGVTVSRFALDVNGEMREGVVVDKEMATQAFETVIRRRIDPGLVEVTRGNNFKARVYPIPAKGYKKALVSFVQELDEKNGSFFYHLPLNFKKQLELFSVKTEVATGKPEHTKRNQPGLSFNFTKEDYAYHGEYEAHNILLDTYLSFSVPCNKDLQEVTTFKGDLTSDNYFYIHLSPGDDSRQKKLPGKITVAWDVSSSGLSRDLEKEIAILEQYLQWMNRGEVELLNFSNTLHERQSYTIHDGLCEELIRHIRSDRYDGATNMGAVDFSSILSGEVLLFTDGVRNFGLKIEQDFSVPLTIINTSPVSDHNLLSSMADASGGLYLNALHLSPAEAVRFMTVQHKQFIKAEYDSKYVSEFYNNSWQPGKGYSFAGIMEGAKSEVLLHFGYDKSITESYRVLIDNTKRISNGIGERIWAQMKLDRLLQISDRETIKAHGKKYRLVTPGTSLIVLDRVEDYARYQILPPPSLRDEYDRIVQFQRKERTDTREQHLKDLCRQFELAEILWQKKKIESIQPEEESVILSDVQIDSIVMEDIDQSLNFDMEISSVDNFDFMILREEDEAEELLEETVFFMAEVADDEELQEIRISENTDFEHADRQEVNRLSVVPSEASRLNVNRWDSREEYMNELKARDEDDLYNAYMEMKGTNGDNPSFYMDVAAFLFQRGLKEQGLRVISNLAEMEMENAEVMRALGRILYEYGFYNEALAVFEDVMDFRSFEPHSYLDLGLTYYEMNDYQKAVENLYKVLAEDWDQDILSRFSGMEMIVLHTMNDIISKYSDQLDISFIDPCFIRHTPADIRVVIDWNADNTDIDLWVTDPLGEKCFFQNSQTSIGGMISRDITQGFGPEEFRLRDAIPGKYVIEVNFYGTRKQSLMNKVHIRAIVYTNFGKDNERREIMSLQLDPHQRGVYTIGELVFE